MQTNMNNAKTLISGAKRASKDVKSVTPKEQ